MKYYRVPAGLDGRAVCGPGNYTGPVKRYLIKNELYTEKECLRYGITLDGLIPVNIPKTKIFWLFGARFETGIGPITGSITKPRYTEITKEEARALYVAYKPVYVTTKSRTLWKLPEPGEYGSHAPAETLFYRSIPEYEGTPTFYKHD